MIWPLRKVGAAQGGKKWCFHGPEKTGFGQNGGSVDSLSRRAPLASRVLAKQVFSAIRLETLLEKGCTFRTVRALLQQFCATDDQPILRPFFWRSQTTLIPGSGPSATPRFSPVQYMPRTPLVSYWILALYSHYVTRCCRAGMVDSGCPRIGVFGAPQNHHHVLETTHDAKHDAPR